MFFQFHIFTLHPIKFQLRSRGGAAVKT